MFYIKDRKKNELHFFMRKQQHNRIRQKSA